MRSCIMSIYIFLWLSEYISHVKIGSVIIQVRCCVKMSTLFGALREGICNLDLPRAATEYSSSLSWSPRSGSGSGGCLSTHFSLVCVTFPQIARFGLHSHSVQVGTAMIIMAKICLLHFNKVDARKQENAAQKWHILKNASVVLVGWSLPYLPIYYLPYISLRF